jgi:hypothetical protein
MPIYDYKCMVCARTEEKFLKSRSGEVEVICASCHIVMKKIPSLIAKTASAWNAGWNAGLDGQGMFSTALGQKVHSRREEEKIMNERGFVNEKDLGKDWFENEQNKKAERLAQQDALTNTYNSKVKEYGGDKNRAAAETFTTEMCLDGTIDRIYNDKITI